MTRVYLDHAAATPMLPEARAAMIAAWDRWANASSPHGEGRAAKRALEDARARIGAALGWDGDLLFTSGATEAAALAFAGEAGPCFVSAVEHEAVRRAAGDAGVIAVDRAGLVDPDAVPAAALVAIQAVNSETGAIQPAAALAGALAARGSRWLADCSQSAGRLPLPAADLLILSAHKGGGPPGIGALLVRDLGRLRATGGQEKGYRGGTENLPAVLGWAAALEAKRPRDHLARLRAHLDAAVVGAGGEIVAADAPRLPEIGSYRLPGMAAAAQLIELDLAGIAVSAGSACSSGTLRPSDTLVAMGWPATAAREVIRVSFAAATGPAEVDRFIAAWHRLAARARAA